MKHKCTINLVGGTITLAMSLAVASVCQHAWADDMTQPVAAAAVGQAPDAIALQAIFMDVQGKVRWRINQNAPWTEAKVNDLLNAGAEIRTGLKSRSTLRVGKNATILVDSGTTFQLPEMVQEGQTLRTLATVKSGRADFKVDHVGFANDFKVVTPQTTLSVRGTGFALASGPLKGVDISGANNNTINAIEVKYIAANIAYFVSGQGKTSSESGRQDPVQNAWVSTIGPPPIAGTMVSQSDVQQQVAQGMAGANPSSNIQQIQQTQAGESNENAIDTALVLASDTGSGGGDSGSGYSLYQSQAQSTEHGLSLLNADAQINKSLSNADLLRFNNNFAVYENGRWTTSLRTLNTMWNGFNSSIGARAMLDNLKSSSIADLSTSDTKLNAISFDARRYFNEFYSETGGISTAAFTDGALLNGATNSLWSLNENARINLGMAVELNLSVQTAFNSVHDSYGRLQVAQQALDGLSTGSAFSVTYATTFTNQFAKLNGFLSNLQNLIGTSTSAQSMEAYAQLAGVVNSAAVHVQLGLVAAKTARDNYNNASSRATQELFQAEELKYLDVVRIRLESIAYLTKERKNADGSAAPDGPNGIKELAEQIMENFNVANRRFQYQSFVTFAQPYVEAARIEAAGIEPGTIVALARLSGDYSAAAFANQLEIDGQLHIMTQQIDFMVSKSGMSYVEGSDDKAMKTGLVGFELKSISDLTSSNQYKDHFDLVFGSTSTQEPLRNDLYELSTLNSLYTGENSIQNQASDVLGQVTAHHDRANVANGVINGLASTYADNLRVAETKAADSRASFSQQFAESRSAADQYLRDFTTIVGANNSVAAQTALAAVTALHNEHNAYVTQAETAVIGAETAARNASSRGEMVYRTAVATQMGRALTIQLAANTAMLHVIANGTTIQDNYSQALLNYNSRNANSSGSGRDNSH